MYAYIQGSLSIGSFESFVVLRVDDEGVRGATRYGSGISRHPFLRIRREMGVSKFRIRTFRVALFLDERVFVRGAVQLAHHATHPATSRANICTSRLFRGVEGRIAIFSFHFMESDNFLGES